jgi:hypothetical protein
MRKHSEKHETYFGMSGPAIAFQTTERKALSSLLSKGMETNNGEQDTTRMNPTPVRLLGHDRPRRGLWQGTCAFALLLFCGVPAKAQEALPSTLMGGPGLIEMPSARMAPDGDLGFNASFFQGNQRYSLNFQALPWFSASFRYAGLAKFDPLFPTYYDRSFAVKLRLWDETDVFPAVAVGLNDIVGTGVYSGEYLVATKSLGPLDLTAGIGWGRLATANTVRNPLALISDTFETRGNDTTGVGQFTLSQYFRGRNIGLFGGVAWRTPIEGLTVLAEYSSDAYAAERLRGNFTPANQLNLGVSYEIFQSTTVALNWLYGKSLAVNMAFAVNPTRHKYSARLQPDMPQARLRTPQERLGTMQQASYGREAWARRTNPADAIWNSIPQIMNVSFKGRTLEVEVQDGRGVSCTDIARNLERAMQDVDTLTIANANGQQLCRTSLLGVFTIADDRADFSRQPDAVTANGNSAAMLIDASATRGNFREVIRSELQKQSIWMEAFAIDGVNAWLYYNNSTYYRETEAVERIARVLMSTAPAQIERFHIVSMSAGLPTMQFDLQRGNLERSIEQAGGLDLVREGAAQLLPPALVSPFLSQGRMQNFPRFTWAIFPQFRQQLFDPSNPFAMQLLAGAQATVQLTQQLSFTAQVEASLLDNFNVARLSDSVLPHVRTDFVQYFAKGKNGIDNLQVHYSFRLAPNVFGFARAGYLESMFAGIGGEILWRPAGQRWALGADFYRVRQRNFDRLFGFQNYEVNTGHVSLYYQSPWYDLNFVVRAGQYLAGDRGLTFEMSRRFSTGIEIGAFFSVTNVSAARFGEGSFDKGIFFRIPVNWAIPISSQNEFGMNMRPVQRDGGQRLEGDAMLYEMTRRSSYGEILLQGSEYSHEPEM